MATVRLLDAQGKRKKGGRRKCGDGGDRLGSVRGFVGCVGGEGSCARHLSRIFSRNRNLPPPPPRRGGEGGVERGIVMCIPCVENEKRGLISCNVAVVGSNRG